MPQCTKAKKRCSKGRNMKKTLAILLSCTLIFCCGCGGSKSTQIVYWVPDGQVYHIDRDCRYIIHRDDVESGTIAQAEADGKYRVCKVCG